MQIPAGLACVILVSLVAPGSAELVSTVDGFNAGIARLAPSWGSNPGQVIVVDMNTGFDNELFTESLGIHPNPTGDRFMALRWYAALSHILPQFTTSSSSPVRILPFGDSITYGCYRWDLWLLLSWDPAHFDFVGTLNNLPDAFAEGTLNSTTPALLEAFDGDHEGHGSWTIPQLTEIAYRVASTTQPQIILYHAGTNDMMDGPISDGTVQEALKNAQLGVQELLRAVPDATILVAQIIPLRKKPFALPHWAKVLIAICCCVAGVAGCAGFAWWWRKRHQTECAKEDHQVMDWSPVEDKASPTASGRRSEM